MITDEQRAAWQALADAATEGPWEAERTHHRPHGRPSHWCWDIIQDEHVLIQCLEESEMDAAETARFIAAARTAVPALLAALRETEAERDKAARAAQTLGTVVEDQCRDIARITASEDMVAEDGDADWGAIWERGYSMRDELDRIGTERDALARRIEVARDILAATRPQYSPLGVECPETAHGLHARITAALDGEDGADPVAGGPPVRARRREADDWGQFLDNVATQSLDIARAKHRPEETP